MKELLVEAAGRKWRAELHRPFDISIPLDFDGPQPKFFGAPPAEAHVFKSGVFEGDVHLDASCNCASYTLTAHCNGTHTEGIGHLTRERVSIRDVAMNSLLLAQTVTVTPQRLAGTDSVITAEQLQHALLTLPPETEALVIRTLPNSTDKLARDYDAFAAAYFQPDAIALLVQHGIEHLVTDLPSLDRADDRELTAHRVFWGMPRDSTSLLSAARPQATVTELAYIPDSVADGLYLLNLQIAPFVSDASPSRPVLYPLTALA